MPKDWQCYERWIERWGETQSSALLHQFDGCTTISSDIKKRNIKCVTPRGWVELHTHIKVELDVAAAANTLCQAQQYLVFFPHKSAALWCFLRRRKEERKLCSHVQHVCSNRKLVLQWSSMPVDPIYANCFSKVASPFRGFVTYTECFQCVCPINRWSYRLRER